MMIDRLPSYHRLTPVLGELKWEILPDDHLLVAQLAWLEAIKTLFFGQFYQIRLGFTCLSIEWKSIQAQEEFVDRFKSLSISPQPLPSTIWKLPVCYDPIFTNDLYNLAASKGLGASDLIQIHSSSLYRIHFFGFLPGFMYLNGLPEILHSPRKKIPDRTVSAGSVAIGGTQTGIYPQQSPGGWHIIGQTPISLFSLENDPPVWAKVGERVQFVPIEVEEFRQIKEKPECWKWS